MNIKSALLLCYWQNKSLLTRMRYDFGREIVVLSSSAILLGLFYYIFRDFLTEKLAHLPSQGPLSHALLAALFLITGPWVGARIHDLLQGETSWRQFASRCGEDPATLRCS